MPKPVKISPSKIYYLGSEEPVVFDFGSLRKETSTTNCFGCDSCNCDVGQVEHQQPEKTLEQIAATQSLQTGHMVSTVNSHNL